MAIIKADFGEGGANLVPQGTGGSPTLATALRDIADDLALTKVATIASADAATQSASYVQADVQSIATLANEIKTALNAIAGGTLKTTKG